MALYRTSAEILADLTDYRAARTVLVKGERIEDVWKDGRRVRFARMTLDEINDGIAALERELEAALAEEAGRPRRRPIGLAWKN